MQGPSKLLIVAAVVLGQVRPAGAVVLLVAEPSSAKPEVSGAMEMLFVQHRDVTIAGCPDAAPEPPPSPDAAGAGADASTGTPDAAPAWDAPTGCTEDPVDAVTMVVQPRFAIGAEGARFAILLVTPTNPLIEVEAHDLFARLTDLTAPEIEYDEIRVEDPALGTACSVDTSGCGSFDYDSPPSWDPPPVDGEDTPPIETVGSYEVARLQPDGGELTAWLDGLGYTYSSGDVEAVMPYRGLGYTVVAVRVAATALLDGGLEPLALTYEGSDFRVPLALARRAEESALALTVYVAANARYDLPGADVTFARYTSWGEASFLTRNDLIVELLDRVPADDPAAASVAGNPQYWQTVVVPREVRVPVQDCGDFDIGCCRIGGRGGSPVSFALTALALLFLLRRRRR